MSTLFPTRHSNSPSLDMNNQMIDSAQMTVESVAREGSFLTRMKTKGVKNREQEHTHKDMIERAGAAQRRLNAKAIDGYENLVSKQMYVNGMKSIAVVESEITEFKKEYTSQHVRYANESEAEAGCDETSRLADLEAKYRAGKISEKRYRQARANIEAGTEEIIRDGYRTVGEILASNDQRFTAMLRQFRGM